ncbi:MAG: hypothetical protein GWP09_03195, partial [Nitrospiraceae bacterium]|nr:hypothetical protein [Nitrospiraceae bacterium]
MKLENIIGRFLCSKKEIKEAISNKHKDKEIRLAESKMERFTQRIELLASDPEHIKNINNEINNDKKNNVRRNKEQYNFLSQSNIKYIKKNPWSEPWIIAASKIGQYNELLLEYANWLMNPTVDDKRYNGLESLINDLGTKEEMLEPLIEAKKIRNYSRKIERIIDLTNNSKVNKNNLKKEDELIQYVYGVREKIEKNKRVYESLEKNDSQYFLGIRTLQEFKREKRLIQEYVLLKSIFKE